MGKKTHLVIGDEVLNGQFGDLADVVVPLLHTKTSETQSGLSSTTVLLGEVDGELVEDLAGVSGERTEEGAVSIHDDEAELGVGLEELGKDVRVELVVAEVEGLQRRDVS